MHAPKGAPWLWMASSVAVSLCLVESARAYEIKRTDTGAPVHWNRAVDLRVDPALRAHLGREAVDAAVEEAVGAWSALAAAPPIAVSGPTRHPLTLGTNDGSVGIYLGTPWPTVPERLAITVSTFDATTGRLLDADILVNPAQDLALLQGNEEGREDLPYDLGALLAHELGHVLGLSESAAPEATMWPRIGRGETHQRTLSPDDRAGIVALYGGVGPEPPAGCGGASVVSTRPPASGILCSLPFAILLLRRRRHRP